MNIIKNLAVGFSVFLLLVAFTSPVTVSADHDANHAAEQCADSGGIWDDNKCTFADGGGGSCGSSFLALPTWYKYLELNGDCEVVGPAKAGTDQIDWSKAAGYIGVAIIEILLRIAALVAIAFVIIGGFRYVTSQGEPENTKSARQTIQNGVIGLVVAMVASAVVAFIGRSLIG